MNAGPRTQPSFASPSPTGADDTGRVKVYLHPGQLYCSPDPTVISCMLGSCVAVCLWDRKLKVGGAVHFLLPGGQTQKSGERGIEDLISQMRSYGSITNDMVANVFGGACVIKELQNIHIGVRNIETAKHYLSSEGILVVSEDVGGRNGRKVMFVTDTGDAKVKTI